jgi:hypothetical protein
MVPFLVCRDVEKSGANRPTLVLFLGILERGESPTSTRSTIALEEIMGILEEAAGAFAAVEGVKKLDPNAGIITEGVAAVAGFEGTGAITNFIEKKEEEKKDDQG